MLVQWNLSVAPSGLSSWEPSPHCPLARSASRLRWPNRTSVPATTRSSRRTTAPAPDPRAGILSNFNDNVAGFATQTSVNLGTSVSLKIGRVNAAAPSSVNVDVYRMGYYGNEGGRLITGASHAGVAVNNLFSSCTSDATTGKKSCANWGVSYTIPGASLPASGVYIAKLTDPVGGGQNTDHVHRPRRRAHAQGAGPLRGSRGDVRGLQRLGRQVAVLRQRRRRRHDLRRPAARSRSPSIARYADPRRQNTLHRPGLLHGPVAGEAGLRRLLHRRRLGLADPRPAARAHRSTWSPATTSTGRCEQFNGFLAARNAGVEHRLLQRQHRLLEGPLRGQRAHARLLQDRPGHRLDGSGQAAPTTGAPTASRAPPTTPWASTGSPAPPTTTPRTRRRPSATTARPPATPTRRPAAASGPTSPRTSSRGDVLRRQRRRAHSR